MGENRDYKYVIQDTTKIYIGAKFEVDELEEDVRIPVKFISSIRKIIPIELQEGMTIDTHLYQLKEDTLAYAMWKQLGIKMKFQNLKPTLKRGKEIYETTSCSFQEGMKRIAQDPEKKESFLTEIQFTKFKLSILGI